jgi:hypothetical protein
MAKELLNRIKGKIFDWYDKSKFKEWITIIKDKPNVLYTILFTAFCLLLIPYVYFVVDKDWLFDLSDKGGIGDAIGGITAPVIGLLGAILVFISFISQVRANSLISNHNEFKLVIDLISELKQDINYLYERRNWENNIVNSINEISPTNNIRTPFLNELYNNDIKNVPAVFKRKLLYILKEYEFLIRRIESLAKLNNEDKDSLTSSIDVIYDCYLDNYCKAYKRLQLDDKKNAKLSETIKKLSESIVRKNSRRSNLTIKDDQ